MITKRPFGETSRGEAVTCYTITNAAGASVSILDLGATVQAIRVPDRSGELTDVVTGYETAADYEAGTCYFGATVGRHANRIGGGRFTLNGVEYPLACNNGPNHLHGGENGFDMRLFQVEPEKQENTLCMKLVSPDGDQGYPGTLTLQVIYSFGDDNALKIHYLAETDRDTVVNLTNHSYFDLSGGVNPMGQCLTLAAAAITANDENTLPTGEYLPVEGTPFDFRQEKVLGDGLAMGHEQLTLCYGYDHNFVLDTDRASAEMGLLRSPETGIAMAMSTDLPGMQLYSGNFITEGPGKDGRSYGPRCAVAMESQSFPNGMAIPDFPKPILRAGEIYDHTTVYRFYVQG